VSPSSGPVLLSDVAAAAGVSLATASRAINGQAGVGAALAEKVREVAHDLGYVANVHARQLAGGTTSVIGLIVHEIDDPFFTEIAGGIVRSALAENLMVQVSHSGRDPEQELREITTLVVQDVDGIIIAGSGYVDPAKEARAKHVLQAYQQRGGRVAVIGRHHLGVDAVLPDNVAMGALAGEHLVQLGHRDVLVAAGSDQLTTIADRLSGIRLAFKDVGKEPIVLHDAFSLEGGARIASRIGQLTPRPSAVIALSDLMAIGVLQELRRQGIRVPYDISVVGIDDITVAQSLAPALTTVAVPLTEMGEIAFGMVRKPAAARPRRRFVPSRLVVRESTAGVHEGVTVLKTANQRH
jgi:LacI family transcriptional regulator, galactose operon repressor